MRCRCASSARRGRAPGAVRFGSTSGPRELSAGGWTPFAVVGQPDTSARPAAAALCAGAAQRAQGAPSAGSLSGVCVRRRCRRAISAPTTAGRRRSIVAGASSLRLWGAFQARARPPPPAGAPGLAGQGAPSWSAGVAACTGKTRFGERCRPCRAVDVTGRVRGQRGHRGGTVRSSAGAGKGGQGRQRGGRRPASPAVVALVRESLNCEHFYSISIELRDSIPYLQHARRPLPPQPPDLPPSANTAGRAGPGRSSAAAVRRQRAQYPPLGRLSAVLGPAAQPPLGRPSSRLRRSS